jgi:hypothetical protein
MIILINGPPYSGKDTATGFIIKHLKGCREYKMSAPLKSALRELLCIEDERWKEMLRPGAKDLDIIEGKISPRQALIKLSEEYLKPMLGDDILGVVAVRRIRRMVSAQHITISDIGFTREVVPILEFFTAKKVRILGLSRPGYDFDNDSRDYLDLVELKMVPYTATINNKYDLEMFEAQIKKVLKEWELLDDSTQ